MAAMHFASHSRGLQNEYEEHNERKPESTIAFFRLAAKAQRLDPAGSPTFAAPY